MTKREQEILLMVVEDFIEDGRPISSSNLISKHKLTWSGATVRSIMNNLEKSNYLIKAHNQSGRMPTIDGYKEYTSNLSNIELSKKETKQIITKLDNLFNKRIQNIDEAIKESVSLISEVTNLATVAKTTNENFILEAINLFVIDEEKSVVTLVVNKDIAMSKVILNRNNITNKDVSDAIDVFNSRLKGTAIKEIPEVVKLIKPILEKKVKNYEEIFKVFVSEIFNNLINENQYSSGIGNIVNYSNSYQWLNTKNLLSIVENKSIWNFIKENEESEKNLPEVTFFNNENDDLKNVVLIDKKISLKGNKTSFALAAPIKVKYKQIELIFKWLEEKLIELDKGGDHGGNQ